MIWSRRQRHATTPISRHLKLLTQPVKGIEVRVLSILSCHGDLWTNQKQSLAGEISFNEKHEDAINKPIIGCL